MYPSLTVFVMHLPSIQRQLELTHAALGHAVYFLEIEAPSHAIQHLDFAKQQLAQLSDTLGAIASS